MQKGEPMGKLATLQMHSEQGCPSAKCRLALQHLKGGALPLNRKHAIRLLRESAEKGHREAHIHLGILLGEDAANGQKQAAYERESLFEKIPQKTKRKKRRRKNRWRK